MTPNFQYFPKFWFLESREGDPNFHPEEFLSRFLCMTRVLRDVQWWFHAYIWQYHVRRHDVIVKVLTSFWDTKTQIFMTFNEFYNYFFDELIGSLRNNWCTFRQMAKKRKRYVLDNIPRIPAFLTPCQVWGMGFVIRCSESFHFHTLWECEWEWWGSVRGRVNHNITRKSHDEQWEQHKAIDSLGFRSCT